MPKVSIVIPAFNAVDSIESCINSLIFQTLKDIEIVVVDDCSTDGTLERLMDFSSKHKRIKLIKNDINSSASVARKKAILASTGKYLMFLDADDILEKNACEIAFKQIEASKVDILQFGVDIKSEGATPGQISWFEGFVNARPTGRLTGGLVKKCFVEKRFGFTLWNKIYRTSIVKIAASKITDAPVYKAQDLLLQFFILLFALSYDSINDKLYAYSYGRGITGGGKFNKEKIIKHMSQSCVVKFICDYLGSVSLLNTHINSIQSIATLLIEDNLASVGKTAGTYLEGFTKDQFLANWGDGSTINFNGDDAHLSGVLKPVFEQIASNKIFQSIHKKPSEDVAEVSINSVMRNLKEDISIESNSAIPVVMAVNENYLPYLSVAVESIKNNSNSKIHLFVFYTEIDAELIRRVKSLETSLFLIEFVDVNPYIDVGKLYSCAHYSVEMYYRLIIAEIFHFVPKVIYLDCDIVVMDDLRDLYDVDLGDCVIGAARNPIHKGMFDYLNLKLKFPYKKYFNSGVLLINVSNFTSLKVKEKCLSFLERNKNLACPDQDALNVVCQDKVKYLSQSWNFQWHHSVVKNDKPLMTPLIDDEKNDYMEAMKDIKILHYTSNIKPWNSPSQEQSMHFWHYAKLSPFFMDVLRANIV
jgi:lipopolysaccharide biosynthesis glycosyltransferase